MLTYTHDERSSQHILADIVNIESNAFQTNPRDTPGIYIFFRLFSANKTRPPFRIQSSNSVKYDENSCFVNRLPGYVSFVRHTEWIFNFKSN